MSRWAVPLADVRIAEDDIAAVADVLRSGWLSMGPRTEALEERFAAYTGAPHALAVTNGTAGLHLTCLAAGLGSGDEVIVPSLTFVASVNAVRYTGATPVFGEIASLREPWLTAADCEERITDRTRAIMTVAYAGAAGETAAVADLARRRGLILLEDAAHAAGSRLDGQHLGTFGLAGAFSFFSNKNLAVGEGGLVVTGDEETAARMRLLRSHGMTTMSWDRHRGHATSYDVVDLGFNYRIDEPRAELALRRLARLDDENRLRGRLVERYRELLDGVEGLEVALPRAPGDDRAHHLFTVVLDEGVDRDAFRASLASRGVQTSVHYPPVHRFAIYADDALDLPLTDAYATRTVTLPLFAHMTEAQQDLVVEAVGGACRAARSTGAARPLG